MNPAVSPYPAGRAVERWGLTTSLGATGAPARFINGVMRRTSGPRSVPWYSASGMELPLHHACRAERHSGSSSPTFGKAERCQKSERFAAEIRSLALELVQARRFNSIHRKVDGRGSTEGRAGDLAVLLKLEPSLPPRASGYPASAGVVIRQSRYQARPASDNFPLSRPPSGRASPWECMWNARAFIEKQLTVNPRIKCDGASVGECSADLDITIDGAPFNIVITARPIK